MKKYIKTIIILVGLCLYSSANTQYKYYSLSIEAAMASRLIARLNKCEEVWKAGALKQKLITYIAFHKEGVPAEKIVELVDSKVEVEANMLGKGSTTIKECRKLVHDANEYINKYKQYINNSIYN